MILEELPRWLQFAFVGGTGLFVGSFLNVAIHRYPIQGESVSSPRRSRCPNCRQVLTWRENVPVLSWAVQRGRCRFCRWPIPVRYPLVELLTAGLWCLLLWRTGLEAWPLLATQVLVVSGLIVATFVDFDCMEIPDSISIGGMAIAPLASLLVPDLHAHTWLATALSDGAPSGEVGRLGALAGCLAGMAVGGGGLWGIGWLGARIFRKEAMGFGDVKLLAAGGGFIGPGGALVALMLASLVASLAGVGNIARYFCFLRRRARLRGATRSSLRSLQAAKIAGSYLPFGPYLGIGIGIALLAWEDVSGFFG